MASDPFFAAISGRRSLYVLSDTSLPIPDARIVEIVEKTIKLLPSSYNVQSARAVILFKEEHKKFWDTAKQQVEASFPEQVAGALVPRIAGFRAAYGSVLWFESQDDLDALGKQHPAVAGLLTEWSDTSSGMHQFAVWTALEAEGLGANLQHYNFLPSIVDAAKKEWNLPADWKLKAQLVFGTPVGGPKDKESKPVEDRVKAFGQ